MSAADRTALFQEIYREKVALYRRHVEGARLVTSYEFNNTYQYVVAREEGHLQWLADAIRESGGEPDESGPALPVPASGGDAARAVLEDDARTAGEFLTRWRTPVQAMAHARHRKMLELMLGEVVEHRRFFEQAAAGREDLLGRRPAGAGTGGGVLPTRWVE
ncbi:MAG: hypothetical protein AB1806_07440 [Acidobacteriota bacterium]